MSVLLESKNVSKAFGGVKAVNNIDMKIMKGDIFGIIGPNGAGKTTFFNVCSGVIPPSSGQVFLNGELITGLKPEQIAQRGMARTFQNIKLFNYMTVLENVKIGFHMHTKTNMFDAILNNKRFKTDEEMVTEESKKVIEEVGLSQFMNVPAGNLAYGIQRKVEIARALALRPEILLLDEPAAGMNPNETWELLEFVKKINKKGYTIAVIEHDMKFVMNLCKKILVINFGTKICEGDPAHVKNDSQVQEAYFGKGTTL
ncbi:ABC transporter ATP-binding protein [Vallitalea maricola]|uniref:ABC transporter ATP-binding protein n=1 Tax=Vallitalea maricola TaxID=3074433 RepID=A0ACB5UR40_9FIRM|nr:ABC transporter ATP-binding protein [Vallitalea sp. AN17-2]